MNKKGFTLVEVIAVVAILALLAVIAVPNVVKLFNSGKNDTMTIQENQVLDAAKLYIEDYCRNPIDKSKLSYCNENKHSLFLFGDVDDNDRLNMHDNLAMKNYINGEKSAIAKELVERADINSDGIVDSTDKLDEKKYVAGSDTYSIGSDYPERVYVCLSTIKEKGYLKDDVLYAGSKDCNGFIAFTKVNRTYSNGKTFLYCGNDEYSTIDYKNSNYKKYKDALDKCGTTITSNNSSNNNEPENPIVADPTPTVDPEKDPDDIPDDIPEPSQTVPAGPTTATVTVIFHSNIPNDNSTYTQTFTEGVSNQRFGYINGVKQWGWNQQFNDWKVLGQAISKWSDNKNLKYNQALGSNDHHYSVYSGVIDEWIRNNAGEVHLYAIWRPTIARIYFKTGPSGVAINPSIKLDDNLHNDDGSLSSLAGYTVNFMKGSSTINIQGANMVINNIIYRKVVNQDSDFSEYKYVVYYNKTAYASGNGLPSPVNSNYINLTYTGYHINSGQEWVCTNGCDIIGKVYDHRDTTYTSSSFCESKYHDCNVVLEPNWIRN